MGRLLFSLGLAALVAAGSAAAHETKHKSLTVIHPWVHETETPEATLHIRIKNTGRAAERLLRATSPLADKIVVLDPQGKESKGLVISGRGELSMKAGGPQIVLTGIRKALRAYDYFDLTLVFEKAGEVRVEVMVEEATDKAPSGG
jgi:copper(I)-binding protein